MKKKTLVYLIFFIVILLSIYGYVYFPENVITQISFSGKVNKSPKIIAILIPLIITTIGTFLFLKTSKNKYFNLLLVGFIVLILNILFNLVI